MGFRECNPLAWLFYGSFQYCQQEPFPPNVIGTSIRSNGEPIFIRPDKIFYPSLSGCSFDSIVVPYVLNGISTQLLGGDGGMIVVGDNGTLFRLLHNNNISSLIQTPANNNNLNDVYVERAGTFSSMFCVGDNGTIIKSTDHGETWELINFPFNYDLVSIYSQGFPTSDTIIVSGSNYSIYKTTNSGNTWVQITLGLDKTAANGFEISSFNKIYFYNEFVGFIGGPYGSGVKTTDRGYTWNPFFIYGFDELYDFYFISPDTGVAVGSPGVARFTTDGGNTWFEDISVTNYLDGRTIRKIVAITPNYGFYFGDGNINSFVARDSTYLDSLFNLTPVEDEMQLPTKIALKQNYPNPFNPSTSIQYAITSRQFVTLKVYDVLGNEVATLVSEEKDRGVYSVNFDASRLATGMYLYRIQAGSFIEAKKMLMIK
jgi:photosystem II stability/assembly factor-like uncharacterized protein